MQLSRGKEALERIERRGKKTNRRHLRIHYIFGSRWFSVDTAFHSLLPFHPMSTTERDHFQACQDEKDPNLE
jgi:hypothetical protein